MLAGFLIQQNKRFSQIESIIASDATSALMAFERLMESSEGCSRSLGFGGGGVVNMQYIDQYTPGFQQLENLYTKVFRDRAQREERPVGEVIRIYDACAVVPDSNGISNLLIVEWAHGAETHTSYEHIRELIDERYKSEIDVWQYWLFFFGFFLSLAMFVLTYFVKNA